MVVNAVGSAVLSGNTRTATGRPAGSVSSEPVLDLGQALLAVAGVPAGRQGAATPGHPGGGQVEQGEPVGVVRPGQVGADQFGFDGVLSSGEPVHARVHLVGGGVGYA